MRFKDNIWAADLAGIRILSSKNKCVKYVLFVIAVFTKYVRVKPLKDKRTKTVLNGFIIIVNESNDTLMYWTYNRGNSVIAEVGDKNLEWLSLQKWQLMIANLVLLI